MEKAYKALAQFYHPDKHPERKEWADEKMKQLNEARELLSNPSKRALHIRNLKNLQTAQRQKDVQIQRMQSENWSLKRNLQSSNQTNTVLGLALLLLGGAIMLGD